MNKTNINSKDLAKLFFDKCEKEKIIAEVFNFFEFDCLERCNTNPEELDSKIKEFKDSECDDLDILADIINIIKSGKNISKNKGETLVKTIKNYIEEHFTEDISLEEIASNLYISYFYMCHFFKRMTGISVNSYINQKRMEKAFFELIKTEKKITDIATECGFNSFSYFTETFGKSTGMNPQTFREKFKNIPIHGFYRYEDFLFSSLIPSVSFLHPDIEKLSNKNISVISVKEPDEKLRFLHEAAIIEYHGVLYASWYNCPVNELRGYTPICGKRSLDGGKTWSELEIIADDKTEKILYCPPVYGIDQDKLYMFVNQMVAPDHIHSLDLYVLNNHSGKFELCWSRPIPFKLNTNVVYLQNGKLMLPGRIGELDGFPNTPAVLISDDGKIDSDWRLVKIAENGNLPFEKRLIHPEISVNAIGNTLYMFCRNDQSRVPLVYISEDCGENWSEVCSHDIPFVSSKIYCGELKDRRHYMVCNTEEFDRSKLVLYLTEDETLKFKKEITLFDAKTDNSICDFCHYPAACEYNNKLYVIATSAHKDNTRGAVLFIIDL